MSLIDVLSNDLTSQSSGTKAFKSVELECTEKIMKLHDSECSEKELALLFNNRGHAKYMQVEFESAIGDYNRALQLNPNLAVAYYNRGTIYYRMGNFREAHRDMQKAVDLKPMNVEFIEGLDACTQMGSAS